MPAPLTTWYPISPGARLYPGPPRGYAGLSGLGSYFKRRESPIDTDYIGPLPPQYSNLKHYGEGGGIGPVVGMSGVASEVGGIAFRLGGTGLGWLLGKNLLRKYLGETGGGIAGAVFGYVLGAGVAKAGGE